MELHIYVSNMLYFTRVPSNKKIGSSPQKTFWNKTAKDAHYWILLFIAKKSLQYYVNVAHSRPYMSEHLIAISHSTTDMA